MRSLVQLTHKCVNCCCSSFNACKYGALPAYRQLRGKTLLKPMAVIFRIKTFPTYVQTKLSYSPEINILQLEKQSATVGIVLSKLHTLSLFSTLTNWLLLLYVQGQRVDLQCPPLGNSFLMESVHVDRKPVLFLSER